MDNNAKKQKIEQLKKGLKKGGKIIKKVSGKILKITEKSLVKTAKLSRKGAKKAYEEYKKLDKDAKRNLHSGLLVGGGILGLAGTFYFSNHKPLSDDLSEQKPLSDNIIQQIPQEENSARTDSIMAAITKPYKITDKESFRQLYEASLPLIQASMIPTEIYREKGYNDGTDKEGKDNTIAIGNYEFPIDGNPDNPEWISTKEYLAKHPGTTVSFEKALRLVDAFFRVRKENGIVGQRYEMLYQHLKGLVLNPHQFTACATCTYNGPSRGYRFCDSIRIYQNNPVKCAYILTTLTPKKKGCKDGIFVRHTAEACMFMYPEFAASVYSFVQKSGINSKGIFYTQTSVNQTTPEQCEKVRDDLERGSTILLEKHKNRIIKYICKNGQTIVDLAETIKDEKVKSDFLRYYSGNTMVSFENARAEITYKDALKEYEAGNYEKALAGFQQLRANGYDGADLRCDIALTHYHLGHYQECIDECRAVLETGEKYLYPRANYNAGKAYEAMGNYERANINYKLSLDRAKKLELNDTLQNVYKNAVRRTDSIINSMNPQPKILQQTKQNKVKPQNNKKQATSSKANQKPSTKAKGNSKAAASKAKSSRRGR